MEFDQMFELCQNLKKSLEKKYGYLDHFNHCNTANPEEISAWCKLCMQRSVYNPNDGSDLKLKTHIRFHVGQLEEDMDEYLKKKKEADEVEEKHKEELHKNLLNNAENIFGFWEYFEHQAPENSNRSPNRAGVCKLCRIRVDYVLGESVSNLREHFDSHVALFRLEARLKEKGKKKTCDGSSSSKN